MDEYLVNLAFSLYGNYKKGKCSLTTKHIRLMNIWGHHKKREITSIEPFIIKFPFNG